MEAQQIKTIVERALVSYSGTSTSAGNVGGTTVVCSDLTGQPDYDGQTILIREGTYAGQARDIDGSTTGGTITVYPAFGGQIGAGINFTILSGVPATKELDDVMGSGFDTSTDSLVKIHDDHVTEISAARLAELDAANIPADVDTLKTNLGDPSGHTLVSLAVKWGDIARSLDAIFGARWDAAGDLGTDIAAIIAALAAASSGLQEQADVAVNTTAPNTPAENDVLNLTAAGTRYIVRHLRLKCANPGANTITVRLYELVNDVLTQIDSFAIDATNFGTYHSLMDMFGLPYLAGDQLQVTVQASAGGPYVVTGQYSHALAT